MSNVPRDTPTPAPTATMFGVPGQSLASVADAHVVFEAAAPVPAALVIVFVMAAAMVGSPIAEVVVDSTVVLLQQFVLVSPASRQQ